MTAWQKVFREAFAPSLSTAGLLALQEALERDDPAILQSATVYPPPLRCLEQEDVTAACPIGYALWKGNGLKSVGELETAFALLCQAVVRTTGYLDAARLFLNFVDEAPRYVLRRELLAELALILQQRQAVAA